MATAFSRSTRSLAGERGRRLWWSTLIVALALAAWGAWFVLARVGVYETSTTARLEVEQAAHPIEAPLAGQVVHNRLVVGQDVQVGDLLLELGATTQKLQLAEEQTRLTTLSAELEALRREAAAQEQAIEQAQQAAVFALEEARAKQAEAEAAHRYAKDQAERVAELSEQNIASVWEQRLAAAEAEQRAAAAKAARMAVSRLEQDQKTQAAERRARCDALSRENKELQGRIAASEALMERLRHEIDRRQVRSPVAGRVAEAASLPAGSFVNQGRRIGAIVPPGEVKIVAQFEPAKALGRIRPGQPAQLNLTGFPWSQYGSVAATVARVGGELHDGRVQVELTPLPNSAARIPIQHGLPGSVEVRVEEISPATLVLRTAGKRFAPDKSAQSPPDRGAQQ